MMSGDYKEYSRPQVHEHGSVASVTAQNDKIGTIEDGTQIQGLDGAIQPDQ
jgi:hypothetical protein